MIAAGGLYTGEDIYRIMALGAAGVQMGSIFVTTDRMRRFGDVQKNLYRIRAKRISRSSRVPVGMPGRAIGGEFI